MSPSDPASYHPTRARNNLTPHGEITQNPMQIQERLEPLLEYALLTQMDRSAWLEECTKILDKPYVLPQELEIRLHERLAFYLGQPTHWRIFVSDNSRDATVYLIGQSYTLATAPFGDLRENSLLHECSPHWATQVESLVRVRVFPLDERLRRRLNVPNTLLINLSVVENFPIPRLSLGIASIASYLRKKQISGVSLIDMQMGYTVEAVLDECLRCKPDIIGLSVNYGQKPLAFQLLAGLIKYKEMRSLQSMLVVGNMIPASSPTEFLDQFPSLIIANKEGELSLYDLARHLMGYIPLCDVRGITYRDDTGLPHVTSADPVDMSEVPLPALDTLPGLASLKGAITYEASRGCDYSKCTFCPRDHKLHSWRALSAEQVLEQTSILVQAAKSVGIPAHIYFADEEFVGELPDGKEVDRIIAISQGILAWPQPIRFDVAARADSVFEPRRHDDAWHAARMEMWDYLQRAGLDRLFVGVESGCDPQLKRLGKGTTSEQNIVAMRMLSSLGINMRIGFIMFDQLMVGLQDLWTNLSFLERTDAIMRPIDRGKMSFEDLYLRLRDDSDFVREHSAQTPIYSIVSYMLSSMEVLVNSPYARMLAQSAKKVGRELILNNGSPDTNMGRYATAFLDERVGQLSLVCQLWIDRNFPFSYTVKSLLKVSRGVERKYLYGIMVQHRRLSHFLLLFMLYALEGGTTMPVSLHTFLKEFGVLDRIQLIEWNAIQDTAGSSGVLGHCLAIWEELMQQLIMSTEQALHTSDILDTYDQRLQKAIDLWVNSIGQWRLINEVGL